MNKNKVNRMGELAAIIAAASAELDALKDEARAEANGEAVSFTGDAVTVSVTKPGKGTETLDTATFKAKAPKLYSEVFSKYHKTGSPRKPAVNITPNK